jgi:hypothetical protein
MLAESASRRRPSSTGRHPETAAGKRHSVRICGFTASNQQIRTNGTNR